MRHGHAARHDRGRLVSASKSAWTDRVRTVYDRSAGSYDLALTLFPLAGFRAGAYRRQAIAALGVRAGQTVVDLGCGTGHNLPLLARAVGEHGHVVGVDVSAGALARARRRTRGLPQVELVQADAAEADLPPDTARVLSTFALSMMPDPEAVIAKAASALPPDGRLAVLDFMVPRSWPALAQTPVFALAARLGETWEMARRDLRGPLSRHVELDTDESFFFGAVYVAAGRPVR